MKNNTKPASARRTPAEREFNSLIARRMPEQGGLTVATPGDDPQPRLREEAAPVPELPEAAEPVVAEPEAARKVPVRARVPESLPVAFSRRTVLVTLDVVRAVFGVDAEEVMKMVESGELQWVFDLSARGAAYRELRFWTRELVAPERCLMTPARAVQLILGEDRGRWRGTEIQQLLLVSRPSVLRWHRSGVLPGETLNRTLWVTRRTLEQFLTERLWWKDPVQPGPADISAPERN
jgi:hypothetical protein